MRVQREHSVLAAFHARAWPSAISAADVRRLAVRDCATEVRFSEHHQQGECYLFAYTHILRRFRRCGGRAVRSLVGHRY